MKLPLLLSKLKNIIYTDSLKPVISVLSAIWLVLSSIWLVLSSIWLLIEMGSFTFPWVEKWARGNGWLFLICLAFGLLAGLVRLIWQHADGRQRTDELSVSHQLATNDILIEIRVDDIFNIEGAFVIGTNTTFDTDMSVGLISPKSLQGQFTNKYYDKVEYLDRDLEDALKIEPISEEKVGKTKRHEIGGKIKCYEIGTVASVCPKDQVVYLVAIAHMNENGKAYSSFKEVMKGLGKLWYYIGEHGELEPLVVPILGTGLTRLDNPREEMIREIIKSFISACSEKKFSEKLTIVISESDYRKYGIDLEELGSYLRYHCKYTALKNKADTGEGEAIP